MKVRLHPMADAELADAVEFYESSRPGLGDRFYRETLHALDWIAKNPDTPRLRQGYRRVNLPVFSHYITYIIMPNLVWVVCVAHAHRKPEYWMHRLSQ